MFEDEFVDCALLGFDKDVVNPALLISVRSLLVHKGAFLAPDGAVQHQPFFFSVERIITEHGARFRAGPELATHMNAFDRVEVRSDDDWLVEQGVWGEPAGPSAGASDGYVMDVARMRSAGRGATSTTSPKADRSEDFDRVLAEALVYPAPAQRREQYQEQAPAAHRGHTYEERPLAGDSAYVAHPTAPTGGTGGAAVWLISGFVVLAIATVGYVAAPDIRCIALGACGNAKLTDDERLERAGATVAQNCAATRRLASDFCNIEANCLAPYRSQFPAGSALSKLDTIAASAASDCAASKKGVQRADAPKRHAGVVLASDQRSAGQRLETGSTVSPPFTAATATATGADAKEAERLIAAARQCVAANPCLAPTCYAEAVKRFPAGARADEIQSDLVNAYQTCSAQPNTELNDGVYNGRTATGCGAPQFGIPVTVQGGTVTWQHDLALKTGDAPLSVHWEGTIDHGGNIRAAARNAADYRASGKYQGEEREITMQYAGCTTTLTIAGRMK